MNEKEQGILFFFIGKQFCQDVKLWNGLGTNIIVATCQIIINPKITNMIKDNEIVTKKYLASELKKIKYDILREVRVMIFESMETTKVHYEETTKRHMTALMQGFQDEMRVYKDEVRSWHDKFDNHEHRITTLETTAL